MRTPARRDSSSRVTVPAHVDGETGFRVDHGLRDGDEGCEVEDQVYITHGRTDGLCIPQVTFEDLRFPRQGCQVFGFTGGKIIQDADVVAAQQEFLHDMGADEPGSASDENAHAYLPRNATTWVMVRRRMTMSISRLRCLM